MAGTSVDTVLFPLDTIKTRLQSQQGLVASGGFRGIFSGLLPAVIGSAPGAAAFFVTYEYFKTVLTTWMPDENRAPGVHMLAASAGEISACVIRVPTEVLKQRLQTRLYSSTVSAVRTLYQKEGILGFYRGYLSTVLREIPFTCIQFPLYEYLKGYTAYRKGLESAQDIASLDAAFCGSLAGGVAAALTTPLDVVKTRIMLATKQGAGTGGAEGVFATFRTIIQEDGPKRLFSGIGPRVAWISAGGFVFLGVYERVKSTLARYD
ncbi:S-adenosylmethionine transporter [Sorochytrium milnesiophthora]